MWGAADSRALAENSSSVADRTHLQQRSQGHRSAGWRSSVPGETAAAGRQGTPPRCQRREHTLHLHPHPRHQQLPLPPPPHLHDCLSSRCEQSSLTQLPGQPSWVRWRRCPISPPPRRHRHRPCRWCPFDSKRPGGASALQPSEPRHPWNERSWYWYWCWRHPGQHRNLHRCGTSLCPRRSRRHRWPASGSLQRSGMNFRPHQHKLLALGPLFLWRSPSPAVSQAPSFVAGAVHASEQAFAQPATRALYFPSSQHLTS